MRRHLLKILIPKLLYANVNYKWGFQPRPHVADRATILSVLRSHVATDRSAIWWPVLHFESRAPERAR